ncbi:protein of unknown function [Catalinimonas alkaloidigena]|uniref:DUF4249 domain-containing protein n=1 Tax=Catalinimonas alkaloidigena TaxID=1075417 RepID=A0A1G9FC15_9BACT|nr:DUF4249 domain-containing protein [Catalinimonas alkaloidigena]SDK85876.1 protein of unknown function [Catalinimonas alkaloidigena]
MRPFFQWLCGSLLLLGGCIDEVPLRVRNVQPILVVEGLITNEPPPYTVQLTYTGNFVSSTLFPEALYVTGAQVRIFDDQGDTTTLKPVLEAQGVYRTTDPTFVGQIGRRYAVDLVLADGRHYVSQPELLRAVAPIDSLSAEFTEVVNFDEDHPYGYQLFAHAQDPAETEDYYRWTLQGYSRRESTGRPLGFAGVCCNSCWVPFYERGINVLSDAAFNGNRIDHYYVGYVPYYVPGLHFVEVSQYSLTREAFQFWQRYGEQLTRTGTTFDPLPAPLEGNVANADNPDDLALGYFGASALVRRRTILRGDTVRPGPYYYESFIEPGDCREVYLNGDLYTPEGW